MIPISSAKHIKSFKAMHNLEMNRNEIKRSTIKIDTSPSPLQLNVSMSSARSNCSMIDKSADHTSSLKDIGSLRRSMRENTKSKTTQRIHGYKRQRSNTMKFLEMIDKKSSSKPQQLTNFVNHLKIEEYNRKKLSFDISKIFATTDMEQEVYKPSIETIHKVFEAFDKISQFDSGIKEYIRFMHNVLRRCVFCKSVDVPQVLIEQIQANTESTKAEEILTASEIPYFSINTEFLNSLNVVIETSKTKETTHIREIS